MQQNLCKAKTFYITFNVLIAIKKDFKGMMKKALKCFVSTLVALCILFSVGCSTGAEQDNSNGGGSADSSKTEDSSSLGGNYDNQNYLAPTSAHVQSVKLGDDFSVTNDDFYEDFSKEEKDLYYSLWETDVKITVSVDIEPKELYKIQEAYEDYVNTGDKTKADTYRRCNLTVTVNGVDYYYEEVGVRMRGNTSRRNFCKSDGTMYDFVHLRFNLTETFDGDEYENGAWGSDIYHEWTDKTIRKQRKNRTFATMEKFYYKWNKNFDNTYIREVYANKMFQAYGILAPHITLCQIKIKQNGVMENIGVGGLYETVDKKFIKRNMEKSLQGGDLYKCGYVNGPANLKDVANYGVETPTQRFTYSLKTNDDRDAPDYHHNAHLKALINTLNSLDVSDKDFVETLNTVLDTDYYTTYEAVNYLLGNPDCIRHNANNYYLYFTPDGVGYFIPYDYDRCLGVTMEWNPDGKALVEEQPFERQGPNFYIDAPLYVKTILGLRKNTLRLDYSAKLKLILKGEWFLYDNFSTMYNSYAKNYSDAAMPSQTVINNVKNNLRTYLFYFSEDGAALGSTSENMQTKAYFERKRTVAESCL